MVGSDVATNLPSTPSSALWNLLLDEVSRVNVWLAGTVPVAAT